MREIQILMDSSAGLTIAPMSMLVILLLGSVHLVPGHQLQLSSTENIFNLNFHLTIFCTEVQKVSFNSCFP